MDKKHKKVALAPSMHRVCASDDGSFVVIEFNHEIWSDQIAIAISPEGCKILVNDLLESLAAIDPSRN